MWEDGIGEDTATKKRLSLSRERY